MELNGAYVVLSAGSYEGEGKLFRKPRLPRAGRALEDNVFLCSSDAQASLQALERSRKQPSFIMSATE